MRQPEFVSNIDHGDDLACRNWALPKLERLVSILDEKGIEAHLVKFEAVDPRSVTGKFVFPFGVCAFAFFLGEHETPEFRISQPGMDGEGFGVAWRVANSADILIADVAQCILRYERDISNA